MTFTELEKELTQLETSGRPCQPCGGRGSDMGTCGHCGGSGEIIKRTPWVGSPRFHREAAKVTRCEASKCARQGDRMRAIELTAAAQRHDRLS